MSTTGCKTALFWAPLERIPEEFDILSVSKPALPARRSPSGLAAFLFRVAGFPHRAALGVFLGQAREPLLRLLRAWTGENPLQPRPANHLDHSRRPQLIINAVILESQRPVPGPLPGTGTRPSGVKPRASVLAGDNRLHLSPNLPRQRHHFASSGKLPRRPPHGARSPRGATPRIRAIRLWWKATLVWNWFPPKCPHSGLSRCCISHISCRHWLPEGGCIQAKPINTKSRAGLLRTLWLAGMSPVIRNPATVWPVLLGLAVVHPVCTPRAYRLASVPSRIIPCPVTTRLTSPRLVAVFAPSEPEYSPIQLWLAAFYRARAGYERPKPVVSSSDHRKMALYRARQVTNVLNTVWGVGRLSPASATGPGVPGPGLAPSRITA